MTIHELKTIPPYFDDVASGRKTFEVRQTFDRTFAAGDVLRLREWQPERVQTVAELLQTSGGTYTGRVVCVRVVYVLTGPGMGIPAHLAVMGIAVEPTP